MIIRHLNARYYPTAEMVGNLLHTHILIHRLKLTDFDKTKTKITRELPEVFLVRFNNCEKWHLMHISDERV